RSQNFFYNRKGAIAMIDSRYGLRLHIGKVSKNYYLATDFFKSLTHQEIQAKNKNDKAAKLLPSFKSYGLELPPLNKQQEVDSVALFLEQLLKQVSKGKILDIQDIWIKVTNPNLQLSYLLDALSKCRS